MDVLGATLLLALVSPLVAASALAIVLTDGRPVLFRQTRTGRDGRPFSILKFRTMRRDADSAGIGDLAARADQGLATVDGAGEIASLVQELKVARDDRVTPLGAFLRRSSLDELPQLLNVLKGDMSLVGPRPLRPFEARTLEPWQRARQELRPGLTGLWQVMGRSGIEWEERMELDYSYVSHWSFAFDLQILARTLPAVIRRDGAV
jgi:lipopolysaccharide/colanic/teichoic acid biosynthesis glycosyltransferase